MNQTKGNKGSFKDLFTKRMLVTLLLGFSSGLPLLATGGTLQARMKDANVDIKLIGLFALVGLPYTLKFLWAPIMDRYVPPFLGRRRGWMLITQCALALAFVVLGITEPSVSPTMTALAALLVSFCSASQDIVLDAHRRDSLSDQELGFGSALFINGYRIGMLVSGAFALFLADHISWPLVYFCLAGFMLVGMVGTFVAAEPDKDIPPPKTLKEAVVLPFVDYFTRPGAFIILAFILFYKLGDIMASHMTTYFILDLGFSKTEFASIAKTFGLIATIVGGLLGGAWMMKLGINKSLWIFGFLQAVTILGFSMLARLGHSLGGLTFVVVTENVCIGMGTAAYAAFMASLCNRRFSAAQYALLSSLMGIPRVILSTPTGAMAQYLGWELFFVACTAIALPGMVLLLWVAPWDKK